MTPCRWKASRTAPASRTFASLNLQVRHQAAVKSTKTAWPCCSSASRTAGVNGFQSPCEVSEETVFAAANLSPMKYQAEPSTSTNMSTSEMKRETAEAV